MIGFGHLPNFGLSSPFHCRVRSRHATDGQTDRRTDTANHFIMPLLMEVGGRGIINYSRYSFKGGNYNSQCTKKG